jgi:transcriptional regulator with GAF, ATPase, and Fis domain
MPASKDVADSVRSTSQDLLQLGLRYADAADFLKVALGRIAAACGTDRVAIMRSSAGRWSTVAAFGPTANGAAGPAPKLLAEALDREEAIAADGWLAVPLEHHAASGELLAIAVREPAQITRLQETVAQIAPSFSMALTAVRNAQRERRRRERLESLLAISSQWNRTLETEPLLVQMAEAATKMLAADRASIFLWDRPNHTLVGRPALGVEGNELRIPDDQGVVGEVIHSREPRMVNSGQGEEQISHVVDEKLGYRTKSLVCVPLTSRRGEVLGAFEVINKLVGDFHEDDLAALTELAAHAATSLENVQERERLLRAGRVLAEEAAAGVRLVGDSPAIEALRSAARRVAETDLAVLILGENGTGKEVVARTIHVLSARRDEPFLAVNCAALTESLLESELFGHEKGAFTDARETRAGKFELANGGTLFLDEIGDLSLGGQSKLLRVLEEKIVVRVGGSKPIHTDARVIAATNQNLAEMVRQKKFRQDLFFRLNVVSIPLPPLRDRPGDIVLLAEHFLHDFAKRARRKTPTITAAARKRLEAYAWPGNVRELRNAMERLAYLCPSEKIEPDDLAFILTATGETPTAVPDNLPLTEATDEFQKAYITKAIDRSGGNMSDAAERLGLHRSNLYRKMRQLGMPTS